MHRVRALLRTRPRFRRLWLGNLISQLGDWIGWVAVSVLALHHGGGALELALVFVAHHLPVALLAPIAGPIADRFDRRLVLLATTGAQAVVTALMAVAAVAGALWLAWLLLLVRSATTAFFVPAERAALPRLVARAELLLAGALDAGTWSVVFVLGMAAGGVLSILGPAVALGLDALSFVLALWVLRGLPAMAPRADPSGPVARASTGAGLRASLRAVVDDVRAAAVYLGPRPRLAQAVFAKAPVALAAGAAWLVLNLVAEELAAGEGVRGEAALGLGLGLLHAVRGLGAGVGPVLATALVERGCPRARVWNVTVGAGLLATAVFVVASASPLALVASALVWGLGSGANWVLSSEALQRLAPDAMLGRLGALDHFAFVLAQSAAVLGAAALIELGAGNGLAAWPFIGAAMLVWWALARRAESRGPSSAWPLGRAVQA